MRQKATSNVSLSFFMRCVRQLLFKTQVILLYYIGRPIYYIGHPIHRCRKGGGGKCPLFTVLSAGVAKL